jgi:F-type H+-transporting ATPase subunit b
MASPPKSEAKSAAPHAAGQAHNGTHTATVADGGHGAGPAAFPPFDKSSFPSQLVWLALTFGFLYWALSNKLLPRLAGVIEHRADGIRADLTEADHLKTETETALKNYETALATAKANASGIAKTQRDALTAETDREKAAAEAKANDMIAAAEKRIAAGKQSALAAVNGVAGETVGAIVAKLTGQTVTADQIAQAISAVKAK